MYNKLISIENVDIVAMNTDSITYLSRRPYDIRTKNYV